MKKWIGATALAVVMCVMISATAVWATEISGDNTILEGTEFTVTTALTITDCISNYGTVTLHDSAIYLYGSFYNAGTIQREGTSSHTNDMEVEGTLYNAGTIKEDVTIQLHSRGAIYLDYESTYTASNIVNDYDEGAIYYEVLDGTGGAISELDGTVHGNFTGINDSKYYANKGDTIFFTLADGYTLDDITVIYYSSDEKIGISEEDGVIFFTMPDEPVKISIKSVAGEEEEAPVEPETPSNEDTTTTDKTTTDTTTRGSTSSGTTASSTSASTATTATASTAVTESETTSTSPKTADASLLAYIWLLAMTILASRSLGSKTL